MDATFIFDRAGQGLFYHGRIVCGSKSFTVVYDCGTSSLIKDATSNLTSRVEEYHKIEGSTNPCIGLLTISHFDEDHVSHIPELLSGCRVDSVMLPHLEEELRLVLLAKYANDVLLTDDSVATDIGESIGIVELFHNPAKFFIDRGAKQVIEVDGDDDDGSDSDLQNDEKSVEPFVPYESNSDYEKSEQMHLHYVSGGHYKSFSSQYSIIKGYPAYRINTEKHAWLFRPMNIREKLPKAFYDEVRQILNRFNDDWRKLLSQKSAINELMSIYDQYIGRANRNTHSLLLRHEPEQYSIIASGKCGGWGFRRHCKRCGDCFHHCRKTCTLATVLLGDIGIDGNARSIINRNRFIDYKTAITLVPHHGADSDDLLWLDNQTPYDGCSVLVVSYGTKNLYKHPRFIYDGTAAKIRNRIAFVNEEAEYCYRIFAYD